MAKNTPKVIKATAQEKEEYKATGPLYPLYGFVKVGDTECDIEDLRCWPKGDPQYEVMVPKGMIFQPEELHSMLCFDMQDIRDRACIAEVKPCSCEECVED